MDAGRKADPKQPFITLSTLVNFIIVAWVFGFVIISVLSYITTQHSINHIRLSEQKAIGNVEQQIQSFVDCKDEVCPNFVNFAETVMKWRGCWNAATGRTEIGNLTLQSGIGLNGEVYRVCTEGNYPLEGITSWGVGDLIIFDSFRTEWLRVDGEDVVLDQIIEQINNITEGVNVLNNFTFVLNITIANENTGPLDPNKEGRFVVENGPNDYELRPIVTIEDGFDNDFLIQDNITSVPGVNLTGPVVSIGIRNHFQQRDCIVLYSTNQYFDAYDGSGDYDWDEVDVINCVGFATFDGRFFSCNCALLYDTDFMQAILEGGRGPAADPSECECQATVSAVRSNGTPVTTLDARIQWYINSGIPPP